MRSMSEEDVVVGVWGTETEAEGWLMLRVCEVFARWCVGTRGASLIDKALRSPSESRAASDHCKLPYWGGGGVAPSEHQKRFESPVQNTERFTCLQYRWYTTEGSYKCPSAVTLSITSDPTTATSSVLFPLAVPWKHNR